MLGDNIKHGGAPYSNRHDIPDQVIPSEPPVKGILLFVTTSAV